MMKKSFWKYWSNDKETRKEWHDRLESLERKLKDFEKAWLAFLFFNILVIIATALLIIIFISIFNIA